MRECMPDRYLSLSWRQPSSDNTNHIIIRLNFLPRTASLRCLKRWKSEGDKPRLWVGCGNIVHPSCVTASWVVVLGWDLALCWSNISHRFLSGRTHWKYFYIFFSMLICVSESELLFLSASHQRESLLHIPSTLSPSCFWLMEDIKELRFSYISIPRSFLSSDVHCSYRLQHCHKHCWAIYECFPPFLSL